jgi:hypothetical protein
VRQAMVRQRRLFEDGEARAPGQLSQEVQQELTHLLVQWMQALAKVIGAEVGDDQDQH